MGGFLGILSMGFFRREYCSGLPFPSLEDLPTQGSNPRLLHWQVGSLPLSLQGSPSRGVGGCTHLLLYSPERHLSRLNPEDGVPFLITGPREVWSYRWSSPSQGTQSLRFISSCPTIWISFSFLFFFLHKRICPWQRRIHFEDMFPIQWERKEKGDREREKGKDKKNGDAIPLLPSKLWIHCPSLDTAAKG